ncbi:carbohydrate kinase [Galbibacter sp. BG1]|uniref:carbohydrate kinase family protein n=1 Tax=Galbibacter sp. BG1 TaxID=1170699 RepID=UPI0015B96E29|nr:carbohydrate kinase [Galbibacter sp. BG1]QLE01325.1 carbohydrate kinase [Galbibacter sp. BG1]
MKKVYCIGELLIDFVGENQGADLSKANQFTKKAGGAPANVATAIARLKGKSEFVGCVGQDAFGDFLVETLQKNNVGIENLQRSEVFTTLAFVSIADNGERDFVFNRGADKELIYNKSLGDKLENEIVHFGAATCFLGGSIEKAYENYLEDAIARKAFISFDPNYRADLWKERDAIFIEKCMPFIQKADFGKFSEEEALLISKKDNLLDACRFLHELGVKIIAVTLGSKGTFLSSKKENAIIESISVEAIDTTGAGDAFVGCFLYLVSKLNAVEEVLNDFTKLKDMVVIANKAGAHTTTKFGAIESLPYAEDLGL